MPRYRAVPVMLSAGERKVLKKRARGAKTAYRDWLRAQIVLAAGRGRPVPGSRRTCTSVWTRSASGGAGSPAAAWMAWRTCPGPGGQGGSARWNGPRWSRWPASCPPPPGCRWPAGAALNWPPRSRRRGWPARSRHPRSCGSWLSTPSSPGNTNRGSTRATRTSPPRPPSSSTSTRGTTRASGYSRATGSSRWTPSPPSRPAADAAKPARQHAAGRCASSTNTSARVPSPCWPPWTCAPGRCSPLPRPLPGSPHSWT